MPDAPIRADVHQALDVHGHLAAEIALHLELALDHLAHPGHLLLRPGLHALVGIETGPGHDVPGQGAADSVDVGDGHFTALVPREIDTGHACHGTPPQPCRCL